MYPSESETITCNYCGQTKQATKDMEEWYCISEVKAEEESNWVYLCSHECMKAWAMESLVFWLERKGQQTADSEWMKEEEKKKGGL